MLEDAVLERVEKLRPELLALVQDLVRIPSENPPGNEVEVAELLSKALSGFGLEVKQHKVATKRVNVEARLEGKGGGRSLLFNGHTDVVPAGPRETWDKDPFSGDFDGKRIWGRGASDMKGALGSIAIALRALVDEGVALKGNAMLHAVADEEARSLGTKYMIEKKLAKADLAIVAESSVMDGSIWIRPAVRGTCWLTIKTEGRAAHASDPARGVNAVLGMCRLLIALNKVALPHRPHKFLPPPTLSSGTIIRGGIKTNVIPPECFAEADIRTVPGMRKEEVLAKIAQVFANVQKKHPEVVWKMSKVSWSDPAEISEDHEIVLAAKRAAKRVTGKEPGLRGGHGTNDSQYLINNAGIPTLCGFGPGDTPAGNVHGPNENVSLAELLTFAKIYALMILWICEPSNS